MLSRCAATVFVAACFAAPTCAQEDSATLPGHLVVVYRSHSIPLEANSLEIQAGATPVAHLTHLGLSVVRVEPATEHQAEARLRAQPEVETVLHDRLVRGHSMPIRAVATLDAVESLPLRLPQPGTRQAVPPLQPALGRRGVMILSLPTLDSAYASPAGWAVRAVGGFGDDGLAGSIGRPAAAPWNISRGAGVRIAILDSGIDARHPDLQPNLALELSEIDQNPRTGLPSPCDDGTPQDQTGHGTWAASLAAAAAGNDTGSLIGVAPQATLLNIKVLQRMPNLAAGPDLRNQCAAGQTGGLMSWVLQGIEDAVAHHADIVSLSLGSLVDLSTGDGAGWKASFDRITYAAAQAGTLIVAAIGNDGLDLSPTNGMPRFAELPAQARDVLAVTASTNPACAEDIRAGAACHTGPVTRPYYSNHGATLNAVAAPGGSYPAAPDSNALTLNSGWIYGACSSGEPNTADGLPANGASFGCFNLGHTSYVQAMGTSASAPLVAGAAAILHAAHPNWTPAQLITALRQTATVSPGMAEPQLNLAAALLYQP